MFPIVFATGIVENLVTCGGEMANVTSRNGVLLVALPVASLARPAQLTPAALSATRGLHAGNMGRPVRPYARG